MWRQLARLLGLKKAPKIFEADGDFIIVTKEERGLLYGRLLSPDGSIGAELPTDSIARYMPYTDFKPYTGDPEPILAKMREALASARALGQDWT